MQSKKPFKPPTAPKPLDKGFFIKRGWATRREATEWMMRQPELYKTYPRKPGESDWRRAQRVVEDIFPTKSIGSHIEKTGKFELQKRRRELTKEQRTSPLTKRKFATKRVEFFDKFVGK